MDSREASWQAGLVTRLDEEYAKQLADSGTGASVPELLVQKLQSAFPSFGMQLSDLALLGPVVSAAVALVLCLPLGYLIDHMSQDKTAKEDQQPSGWRVIFSWLPITVVAAGCPALVAVPVWPDNDNDDNDKPLVSGTIWGVHVVHGLAQVFYAVFIKGFLIYAAYQANDNSHYSPKGREKARIYPFDTVFSWYTALTLLPGALYFWWAQTPPESDKAVATALVVSSALIVPGILFTLCTMLLRQLYRVLEQGAETVSLFAGAFSRILHAKAPKEQTMPPKEQTMQRV